MVSGCSVFCSKMNRLKTLTKDMLSTPLSRCLTVLDMTLLGIGYMIGPGIYVVTGTVVRDEAGPGAIISYLIAGVAATFSALCYAEFGARVPLAGSAYTYTYVTMGEFWAFTVGWNMLLEYLIAVSSSAKAWSATLNSMVDDRIKDGIQSIFGVIEVSWMGSYLDFIAVLTVVIAVICVISGAKNSVVFNNILAFFVVVSIFLIVGTGFSHSNIEYWRNDTYGGFLPFGMRGVFQGAATSFYSYLGFDGIAVAGEEAINPKMALPWATCISMISVTLLYVLATAALTLMIPYQLVNVNSPFPEAFKLLGIIWAKYAVAVGGLIGISTSITGGMFFLPRIAYSMASDGLLFSIFGKVWERTQTPALGIIILGSLAALLAFLIELKVLVLLMSIGTLISFSFVAASVIVLRYRLDSDKDPIMPDPHNKESFNSRSITSEKIPVIQTPKTESKYFYSATVANDGSDDELHNTLPNGTISPTKMESDTIPRKAGNMDVLRDRLGDAVIIPGWYVCGLRTRLYQSSLYNHLGQEKLVISTILLMVVNMACVLLILLQGGEALRAGAWWIVLLFILFLVVILGCLLVLSMLTQQEFTGTFQVPLVPFLPALSIFTNLAMILMLDYLTWIRLAIWMTLGTLLYVFYGYRNSRENDYMAADIQLKASYGSSDKSELVKDMENTDLGEHKVD